MICIYFVWFAAGGKAMGADPGVCNRIATYHWSLEKGNPWLMWCRSCFYGVWLKTAGSSFELPRNSRSGGARALSAMLGSRRPRRAISAPVTVPSNANAVKCTLSAVQVHSSAIKYKCSAVKCTKCNSSQTASHVLVQLHATHM